MAAYSRREKTTRTVEYVIPADPPYGACLAEVAQAVHAATNEMRSLGLVDAGLEPADDQLRVVPADDEVLVRFTVPDPEVQS